MVGWELRRSNCLTRSPTRGASKLHSRFGTSSSSKVLITESPGLYMSRIRNGPILWHNLKVIIDLWANKYALVGRDTQVLLIMGSNI